MAYSGEGQLERLAQRPQRVRKNASAPARELTTREGLSGTTPEGNGAIIPEMRRSRAEQSLGAAGRSSSKQAPSKTSAGVTSGSETMIASELSDHGTSQSPGGARSSLPGMVTLHRSFAERVQPWPATDEKFSGGLAFAIWVALCGLSFTGVIWTALTLIDAWSKV
jgi:hypothetical protein